MQIQKIFDYTIILFYRFYQKSKATEKQNLAMKADAVINATVFSKKKDFLKR